MSSTAAPSRVLAGAALDNYAGATALPHQRSSAERTLQAETFATEKLWMWQKRLNLQDWNITVQVSRASELKPKTLGNVHWDLEKKTATIRVLDPVDYRLAANLILPDIELTVVHELIHLEMAPTLADLHRTDANRVQEETAVNRMADALLALERGLNSASQ